MEYPKHIFFIALVFAILLGICMLGMNWIGLNGFLLLLVLTIPIYFLEIYLEQQARKRLVEAGKLEVFIFKKWNLDSIIYFQFIIVFVLIVPDLMFGVKENTIFQNLMGLLFSVGLVLGRTIKIWPLRQAVTLEAKNIQIHNYGYVKNIKWENLASIEFDEDIIKINFQGAKSHTVVSKHFQPNVRKSLLDSLQRLALKNGIPITGPKSIMATIRPLNKFLKKMPKLLLFMLFLVLDILLVTDLIIALFIHGK